MKTRDEYVATLKTRLDDWNADVTKWEAKAKVATTDMKKRYAQQLEEVRARREEAMYQMKLLQDASAVAWSELSSGADGAWDRMQAAMVQARSHFEKQ